MSEGIIRNENNTEQPITREIAEFVSLDAILNPDNDPGAVWQTVAADPRFRNLIHAAIEYGNRKYIGTESDAIVGYEGFIEGVSFAVEVMRQTLKESAADTELSLVLGSSLKRQDSGQ